MRKILSLVALAFLTAAVPGFAKGGFGVTDQPSWNLLNQVATSGAKLLVADFSGDGRDDFAVTGSPQLGLYLPVSFSNGDGGTSPTNDYIGDFATWATEANVKILVGDFNADGKADIALAGGATWGSCPVAFSQGDGSFDVENEPCGLATWAQNAASRPAVGDYNGDGRADIALLGLAGIPTVPVAFSNGDGTFNVTYYQSPIGSLAAVAGAQILVGDYTGDGLADIGLTGPSVWQSVPVALSNGDGSFGFANQPNATFAHAASLPNVKILPGDYNGDHRLDIALTGYVYWDYVPVAFSVGGGNFSIKAEFVPGFPGYTASADARVFAGDFNTDGKTDLAVTGVANWQSVPVAFSYGNGFFDVQNQRIVAFGGWAPQAPTIVSGDFNADQKKDLALIGPSSWQTLPMAFSLSPP